MAHRVCHLLSSSVDPGDATPRRFLDEHGFEYTASVSNKLMVDARNPTTDVIAALKQRNVYVGRPWPVWPTHVRISILGYV